MIERHFARRVPEWSIAYATSLGAIAVASGCAPPSQQMTGPDGSAITDATGSDGSATTDAAGSDVTGSPDGSGTAPQLPDGTLLYVRHVTSDRDVLVARDLATNTQRIVTDLTGDGSSGWEIDSYALSPDRRRIALSSLYGPTSADTATGLATNAIWTLATDGTDFRRLTPTFPADSQGRQGFSYEVGDPEWTADGSRVVYDFGTYWWEGTNLRGGSFPWLVPASGGSLPTTFPVPAVCSVIHPSRNPVTGDFVFIHSVCVPGQGEDGIYLYPAAGSTNPTQLIASAHVDGRVDVFLARPAWFSDGSGFLFIGGVMQTEWRPSVLAYDNATQSLSLLVTAPTGTSVWRVALSPDATKLVYCLHDDSNATNLHLIDLSAASPTDVAITTDGQSCDPSF